MTPAARRLYGEIAEGGQPDPETRGPELEQLAGMGLVVCEAGRWVALEPRGAMARHYERELAAMVVRLHTLSRTPVVEDELTGMFERAAGSSAGSVFLPDAAAANACIQDVVAGAREEILSAQPGGPRSRELMLLAVRRDSEALRRGVKMRTLYRDTVRDHEVTREWAATMTAQGGLYRTLHGPFQRIIIVDRRHAFISDLVTEGAEPHAAWHVTDRAVVACMAQVYEDIWHQARPWFGEGRDGQDAPSVGVDGVRTTPFQREILRDLAAGRPQRMTAARLGIGLRTLTRHIDDLKDIFQAGTVQELTYQFALSADHRVDDTMVDTISHAGPENAVA
ncbi:hypothetical protein ACIQUW_32940 [Streptomyces sp. NPDC101117]|uniref:hypothetical protein n=1 Tax=Streptomyces sp. NPDC101117 TaxID=3366108 RepID=UPI00381852D8